MESTLKFVITRITGEVIEQEIKCPPESREAAIERMLAQYAQVGMLKRDGNTYRLLAASQIAEVTVELPTIIIASPDDQPKPPTGGKLQLL